MGGALSCTSRQKQIALVDLQEQGLPGATDAESDVIIPDKVARPLLVSSNLLLVTAVIALRYNELGIACTSAAVWITSLLHWVAPRFSSPRRYLDYIAVSAALLYGSYVATTRAIRLGCGRPILKPSRPRRTRTTHLRRSAHALSLHVRSPAWTYTWFGGLALITFVFICNETAFYLQVMRSPTGKSTLATLQNPSCLPPTTPWSPARYAVYRRAVWIHLVCVHVLANALATVLVVWGVYHF